MTGTTRDVVTELLRRIGEGDPERIAEHHVPEAVGTEIERILVDGPDAVVTGEIRRTARATHRSYRARFALHLTVENGLITRHPVYEDSLAVARAFAP
ncbi:nuclear transport factor 2 family protein [Streptomyces sp. NPDC053560]|uniref:nuclear transport factor 2 family protein n=1 Tax=Streptomyces sp. NPDC053560 TaxID=3365711 RepID=UPI0037D8C9E2